MLVYILLFFCTMSRRHHVCSADFAADSFMPQERIANAKPRKAPKDEKETKEKDVEEKDVKEEKHACKSWSSVAWLMNSQGGN